MDEVKPVPAFRLRQGCEVAGYTLLHPVGRGWESTSYLAAEHLSGAMRRLKLYRLYDPGDIAAIGHAAATFERLHGTGAVPTYHHMGIWRRNARESVPFLAFGFIDGEPLVRLLKPGRWRRGWNEMTGLRLLSAMAGKLAAVHALGLAVGDFADGNNVIVQDRRDPVWCDLDPGSPDEPNQDQANDLEQWFTILDAMAKHEPVSPLIAQAVRRLGRIRSRRFRAGTMSEIVERLSLLLEPPGG
ncbi:hypothetical protein M2352_000575 [Azospirillum fermentarium]|uniref:hypothetical protein n=1 Tax=Azospirillum fermentarium TaxID=1233114 RepID=UPI0022260081|nr:hypothetical protein [Azospirillum fermentarium]MCW2244984.1 hypothetical protein [Azospirillum fermentarium]